jgi:O-antigen ligase
MNSPSVPRRTHAAGLPPGRWLYRWLDGLSGLLIGAVILWGPWSFGCTPPWAIAVQNVLGYTLGGLLLLKLALRRRRPALWRDRSQHRNWMDAGLVWVSGLLLLYMLISAWNARVVLQPGSWSMAYRDSLSWLPHSFDQERSWRAFAIYLGLAGFFWAVRDWILHPPPTRPRPGHGEAGAGTGHEDSWLPRRVRVLLWILSVNGALLAIQSIAQRVSGSEKLLWLLEPRVNKEAVSFFGPYAYRANAAQYFNLIWPVTLGLWWTYQRAARRRGPGPGRGRPGHLLVSCMLLMAVCPIVSTSRGGAIIMGGLTLLALGVLGLALWRSAWGLKLALLTLLAGSVGLGVLLGWEELGPRMELVEQGYEQREALFYAGQRMTADAPLYGLGPGTFRNLFRLYMPSHDEDSLAQMHNDWLETRITFGWLGLGLLLAALALAMGRWFTRGGLPGEKYFVLLTWCALGGCLVHARFDFPFQIVSIVALFLLLCAVLSCLSRPRGQPA